jgi:hypothetical protein
MRHAFVDESVRPGPYLLAPVIGNAAKETE